MNDTLPTPDPVARLVADLEAATAQYEFGVPLAHLRLILDRYRRQLPEPRHVDSYHAVDVTAAAEALIDQAEPCDDPRCRKCWLPPGDRGPYAPGVDPEQWLADQERRTEGIACTSASEPHGHAGEVGDRAPEPGERRPCQTCGILLEWTRHPDREQCGWREVTR